MAELIKKTDTLNQGREKLNEAITDANRAKWDARTAKTKAEQALLKSESTQTQLNEIVIEGDSSIEAAQARVSSDGTTYGTLKQRLDTEHGELSSQLAQMESNKADKVEVETKATLINERYNQSLFMPRNIASIDFTKVENYVYDILCYLEDSGNMQGITYYDGIFYVGFDVGGGNGVIRAYYQTGKKMGETDPIPIGHSADLAYHHKSDTIFVANGGGSNPTFIYQVHFETSNIIKVLDYSHRGNSGLCAVNNTNETMIVHTGTSDNTNHRFTIIDMNTWEELDYFEISNEGIPQGLEAINNEIYLYTNNKITVIGYDGTIIGRSRVEKLEESEGITFAGDFSTPFLAVGYNNPNRIYAFRTFENDKTTSLKPLHSMNRNDKSSLMARFVNIGLRHRDGEWTPLDWTNFTYGSHSQIESITVGSSDVRIELKSYFRSIGYFTAEPDWEAFYKGVYPHAQLMGDGKTIQIRFYNHKEQKVVPPSEYPDPAVVMVFMIGGVHFKHDIRGW